MDSSTNSTPRFQRGRFSGIPRSTVSWKANRSSTYAFARYGAASFSTFHLKYAFHTGSGVSPSNLAKAVR